jgi:hypothetical protein
MQIAIRYEHLDDEGYPVESCSTGPEISVATSLPEIPRRAAIAHYETEGSSQRVNFIQVHTRSL